MTNERLAELMSRKLSGEATSAELQELYLLLQTNPGDQYFSEILLTYWNNRADNEHHGDHAADQHFAHILEMAAEADNSADVDASISPVSINFSRTQRFKKFAVAAGIVGILGFGAWMLKPVSQKALAANETKLSEVVAGRGIRSKMVLPDGTQVWLNSDSKLLYDEAFNGEQREVTLEGEAYFDVVKNPKRPFIVHTSAIDIRVLGTAFNVKSYPQDKTIETTLIHGLVEVINKNRPESSKIILRPKEKLVFNKVDNAMQTGEVAVDVKQSSDNNNNVAAIAIMALPKDKADTSLVETSWVYNRLVFDGDSFTDLAIKMERWFNVKIVINNEKIANYRLSGTFEDENIVQVLQALQIIYRFNYEINNNEVEITE